mmetsp:Transcript_23040/g.44788  ORF Transcript_23040/g.44788 Transcript_23040/m.44788 type:complete len:211 (+) Transcript_23040:878-1510(+)
MVCIERPNRTSRRNRTERITRATPRFEVPAAWRLVITVSTIEWATNAESNKFHDHSSPNKKRPLSVIARRSNSTKKRTQKKTSPITHSLSGSSFRMNAESSASEARPMKTACATMATENTTWNGMLCTNLQSLLCEIGFLAMDRKRSRLLRTLLNRLRAPGVIGRILMREFDRDNKLGTEVCSERIFASSLSSFQALEIRNCPECVGCSE